MISKRSNTYLSQYDESRTETTVVSGICPWKRYYDVILFSLLPSNDKDFDAYV